MAIISLTGMEFHAFHGVYAEEQAMGTTFVVDISIETKIDKAAQDDDLHKTINYEKIFQICKGVMDTPVDLIETVVFAIKEEIQIVYSTLEALDIKVHKKHPPLGGQVEAAAVQEKWDFRKKCGRCKKNMVCYNNAHCWCKQPVIPKLTLQRINEQFGTNCLCKDCLSDYAIVD